MFKDKLKKVVVIGAAGKMGSGISLLALPLVAEAKGELILLDSDAQRLDGLRSYLEEQLDDKSQLSYAQFTTDTESCTGASLVFEAIIEDIDIKTQVYRQLKSLCDPDCYFLSNTSSVPISILDDSAQLGGRLLGFHFYNPPPVQKLVELIWSDQSKAEARDFAQELGKRMGKVIVPSRDVAGFIGNGHFMRDILFACQQVAALSKDRSTTEAVYMLNRISQDWLVRPMGIFQLVDYVGLDVCQNIFKVMTSYIEGESFGHPLLDQFQAQGKCGGQNADGSQKNGILKYEKNKPVAVWCCSSQDYQRFDDSPWKNECDAALGPIPGEAPTWKSLRKDPDRLAKLDSYFNALQEGSGLGCEVACHYLERSREIAEALVADGVAEKLSDVDEVLMRGFAHLYGPSYDVFGPVCG